MRKSFYMNDRTVIINFSAGYCESCEDILSSEGFGIFLGRYLKDLAVREINIYSWLTKGRDLDVIVSELTRLFKQLLVLKLEEMLDPMVDELNRLKLLFIVHDAYNFWMSKERFSVLNANAPSSPAKNFMDEDNRFNQLVLKLYRSCEGKLQDRENRIYHQPQAGTNASALIRNYRGQKLSGYGVLKNIPFVNTLILRTPMLLHSGISRKEVLFEEAETNPVRSAEINQQEWYCYPAKVGNLLGFVYFHRDCMSYGLSLGNLYELATEEECISRKPDFICLFGNKDEQECRYFYDAENDIWTGSVSLNDKTDNMGCLRKMIMTLHNARYMQKKWLPVHGTMLEIIFRDGLRRSMIMIGDSDIGKSETIEMLKKISLEEKVAMRIASMETVFDDMGTLHIENGHVYAQGSETGVLVKLEDMYRNSAYRDMGRSVFFNAETDNARVVSPLSPYDLIGINHSIDLIIYANNFDDRTGVYRFEDAEEGRRAFDDCISTMHGYDVCSELMDEIYEVLRRDDVFIGEVYTNMATGHREALSESARQLLKTIREVKR